MNYDDGLFAIAAIFAFKASMLLMGASVAGAVVCDFVVMLDAVGADVDGAAAEGGCNA